MGAELEHWKAAHSLKNYADGAILVAKTRPSIPPAWRSHKMLMVPGVGRVKGSEPRFKVAVSFPFVHMDSQHVSTDSNPDKNDPPT